MKLKIISGNNYLQLEPEVNTFMATVEVVQVEVKEVYDIGADSGFVTYHIFYNDRKPRNLRPERPKYIIKG